MAVLINTKSFFHPKSINISRNSLQHPFVRPKQKEKIKIFFNPQIRPKMMEYVQCIVPFILLKKMNTSNRLFGFPLSLPEFYLTSLFIHGLTFNCHTSLEPCFKYNFPTYVLWQCCLPPSQCCLHWLPDKDIPAYSQEDTLQFWQSTSYYCQTSAWSRMAL